MTRQDHLLVRAMEECAELAQRLSKALIFGMAQVQKTADDKPEQNQEGLTNLERIYLEYYDLRAVLGMAGIDAWDMSQRAREAEQIKREKVEKYLKLSESLGRLEK